MIFHFKPVPSRLDDPSWKNSPYVGECWVNAANETEARGLISGRYENANANIPGRSEGASPWMDANIVAAEELLAPPAGMDIPNGVVIADRQL